MNKSSKSYLKKWLISNKRAPSNYKFSVVDVIESSNSDHETFDYLGRELLLAHGSPKMIEKECEKLIRDAEENHLDVIKKYVEKEILPSKKLFRKKINKKIINPSWIGNFGEVLAAKYLIEFEEFWLPIYKLRFREKKDWAPRLTDLCLIKHDRLPKPMVCYGEVKTKSIGCNKKLAVEGHCSFAKDDALSNAEILRFISTWLYETDRIEEAGFISDIRSGLQSYDKKHILFLIHNKESWLDEILDNLECCELDQRLVDFTVNVVLIANLGEVINSSYDQAWKGALEIVNE